MVKMLLNGSKPHIPVPQNSSIIHKGGKNRMFFQRLEDLRIDHDKTQQQIADVLQCKREVYRRYEKGTRELPVWALIKLANYYGTTTDYILGIEKKE